MPKPAPKKNLAAYTLIEILVGLTIVGLVFGAGYISFREFARRQALAGVARSLKSDLRLAQEQALAGKKPSGLACNSPNTLSGYYFDLTSPTAYNIAARCSGGNIVIKQVVLSLGITAAASSNPTVFKVIGQGTEIPTGSQITITLTQAGTGNTGTVTITSTGEIK